MKPVWSVAFLFVASLSGAGAAIAAPASGNANASAQIVPPLSVVNDRNLDFGVLSFSGAGTATIDPATDGLTTTGGVVRAGGSPIAAKYTGSGPGSLLVYIRVPSSVTLTRSGGTETIIANAFTIEGGAFRLFPARTGFNFRVGATLSVAATQVPGLYGGPYNVDVIYF